MTAGDSGCEAYTAIAWGVGLSHERSDIAGAESFYSLEGNMCGTVMRGAVALPGSKATSRAKGSHRKLGGLASGRQMLRDRAPCSSTTGTALMRLDKRILAISWTVMLGSTVITFEVMTSEAFMARTSSKTVNQIN